MDKFGSYGGGSSGGGGGGGGQAASASSSATSGIQFGNNGDGEGGGVNPLIIGALAIVALIALVFVARK